MSDDGERYCILRFAMKGRPELVAVGLTLDEAKEHCRRDDTRGDGWFDGYDLESNRPGAIQVYEQEQMNL